MGREMERGREMRREGERWRETEREAERDVLTDHVNCEWRHVKAMTLNVCLKGMQVHSKLINSICS